MILKIVFVADFMPIYYLGYDWILLSTDIASTYIAGQISNNQVLLFDPACYQLYNERQAFVW